MERGGNSSASRSAWTEQEDDLLRNAVDVYGERSWANVAQLVPGRSSKSCSDRWRNFLSPDIEHPRKSPFTEWEIAVVVLAQARYGNNWKAISMLLPGRTNRAVKNLFVGNLKWGARLTEVRNRFLEWGMTLEALLEIKPDHAGGPVKPRPGQVLPAALMSASQEDGTPTGGDGSPTGSSFRANSTSSAGSAWQSDMTEQPLNHNSPRSATGRRRAEGDASHAPGQSPQLSKRRRAAQSPVLGGGQQQQQSSMLSPSMAPHPGALGPGFGGLPGSPTLGDGLQGSMGPPASRTTLGTPTGGIILAKQQQQYCGMSSDGTGNGGQTSPTSDHDGSPANTPAGALAANLAGGCFGPSSMMQQQHQQVQQQLGARSNSMPGASMLGGGDAGAMAGRVASWHFPGQMVFYAGTTTAAAAAMGGHHGGAGTPFQQVGVQMSAVAGSAGSLAGMLAAGNDRAAAAAAPVPAMKLEAHTGMHAAAAPGFHMQHQQHMQQHLHHVQHQQWLHAHHHHHAHYHAHHHAQQQHQHHAAAVAAAAAADAAAQPAAGAGQAGAPGKTEGLTGASAAAAIASVPLDHHLSLPGSPMLTGNILHDMRSNDSAGLHQMLEQILNEDMAALQDPALGLMSADSSQHRRASSAYDPPVVSLPSYKEPTSTVAAQCQHAGQEQAQQQQQQQAPAQDAMPAGGAGAEAQGGGDGGAAAAGHASWGWPHAGSGMQRSGSTPPLPAGAAAGTFAGHGDASSMARQRSAPQQLGLLSQDQQQQGHSHGGGCRSSGGGHVSDLCAQLQQENLLLMHRLHSMDALDPCRGLSSGGMAPHGADGVSAHTPGPTIDDSQLPQLPHVLTRVGGSLGGSAGGAALSHCHRHEEDSPAELINTSFMDDHNLLTDL